MVDIEVINTHMRKEGKKIKNFQCFYPESGVEFSALKNAKSVLDKNGYCCGDSYNNSPIAIREKPDRHIPRWDYLTLNQRRRITGLLISENFKDGDVLLFLFKDIKNSVDLDALKYEMAKGRKKHADF